MTFHHICGSKDASGTDCKFSLRFEHEDTPFFEIDASRLLNGGAAASATEWFWEEVKLPPAEQGARIKYTGEFDSQHGVMNLDNIHIQTRQR